MSAFRVGRCRCSRCLWAEAEGEPTIGAPEAFWAGFISGGLFLIVVYFVARLGSALAGH